MGDDTLEFYEHVPTPDFVGQDTARRAALKQFQNYPDNSVQGLACLTFGAPGRRVGKYFSNFQPAQVVQNPIAIMADLLGGGVDAGQIAYQPLLPALND